MLEPSEMAEKSYAVETLRNSEVERHWSNAFVIGNTQQILREDPLADKEEILKRLNDPIDKQNVVIRDDTFVDAFLDETQKIRDRMKKVAGIIQADTSIDIFSPINDKQALLAGRALYEKSFPNNQLTGKCRLRVSPFAITLELNQDKDFPERASRPHFKKMRIGDLSYPAIIMVIPDKLEGWQETFDIPRKRAHEEGHATSEVIRSTKEALGLLGSWTNGFMEEFIAEFMADAVLNSGKRDYFDPELLLSALLMNVHKGLMRSKDWPLRVEEESKAAYDRNKKIAKAAARLLDLYSSKSSADDWEMVPENFNIRRGDIGYVIAQYSDNEWIDVLDKYANEVASFRKALTVWRETERKLKRYDVNIEKVFGINNDHPEALCLDLYTYKGIEFMNALGVDVTTEMQELKPLTPRNVIFMQNKIKDLDSQLKKERPELFPEDAA